MLPGTLYVSNHYLPGARPSLPVSVTLSDKESSVFDSQKKSPSVSHPRLVWVVMNSDVHTVVCIRSVGPGTNGRS